MTWLDGCITKIGTKVLIETMKTLTPYPLSFIRLYAFGIVFCQFPETFPSVETIFETRNVSTNAELRTCAMTIGSIGCLHVVACKDDTDIQTITVITRTITSAIMEDVISKGFTSRIIVTTFL